MVIAARARHIHHSRGEFRCSFMIFSMARDCKGEGGQNAIIFKQERDRPGRGAVRLAPHFPFVPLQQTCVWRDAKHRARDARAPNPLQWSKQLIFSTAASGLPYWMDMKFLNRIIISFFACCAATTAFGWGDEGHKTIGAMADKLIAGTTRSEEHT